MSADFQKLKFKFYILYFFTFIYKGNSDAHLHIIFGRNKMYKYIFYRILYLI